MMDGFGRFLVALVVSSFTLGLVAGGYLHRHDATGGAGVRPGGWPQFSTTVVYDNAGAPKAIQFRFENPS